MVFNEFNRVVDNFEDPRKCLNVNPCAKPEVPKWGGATPWCVVWRLQGRPLSLP